MFVIVRVVFSGNAGSGTEKQAFSEFFLKKHNEEKHEGQSATL